ncbi:hypothetical protein Tco_0815030 [Tanacetum coccineum]
MMVSAQEDMGEASTAPTDSHSTPIITQPSTSKPQKKQSRKKQRKNSGPTEPIPDETTNEEHVSTPSCDPPQSEIATLKERLKKLEQKRRFKIYKPSRLYKGRSIDAIDRDTEVTLVDETQRRTDENDDNLMFDTGVFDGDEIVLETEEPVINSATTTKLIPEKDVVQESSENVSTATTMVSTATTIVISTPAITTPPQKRAKGIAFKEPVKSTVTTIVPSQKSKDKGKEIMIEPEMPLKKKYQIELDEDLIREIDAEEQAELERIQKERATQEEASKASVYEEWDNEQAMMEADYEKTVEDDKEEEEFMKCFELAKEEEIAINAIPLATKVPIVGFQIHTRGKPGYYEIFRADGSSKLYHVFSQLLSDFDREDLVNLWKLVKAKHGDNRLEEDFERVL